MKKVLSRALCPTIFFHIGVIMHKTIPSQNFLIIKCDEEQHTVYTAI